MSYIADAVTMQVIRYGLDAIADDMGKNLMRMGRTTIVKEIQDINCAVLDAEGGILAQANLCPLMLFSLPETAENMLEVIETFDEGDVVVSNDPYTGGQHLLDVQFFAPVHYEGKLRAIVANIAHQLDMGGAVPGGVAGGLTEIYQEGLRLPFVKLYRAGEEDRDTFRFIGSNIRIPEKTLDDFRAQAATTLWGVQRVQALIDKYGLEVFMTSTRNLQDYAEQLMRKAILRMPSGRYVGHDQLDDDGIEDKPVPIQVNVAVDGDHMIVDFEGTSAQTTGNVNCPWACTKGAVYYTMIGIVDPYMVVNAGTFRPIAVASDDGLVTKPLPPAGVTARSQTMTKIVEAMLKAMSEAVPSRVVAGSHGQACTCSFVGKHPQTQRRFAYVEIQGGGAGARPDKDGPDGQDLHLGRFMNTPVEAAELENPVIIERYEMIPDSGGAGEYRGGLALRRDIRFLTDVSWARYADRQKFAPQGLFGGLPGTMGRFVVNPGAQSEKIMKSKGVDQLTAGDLLSIRLPGSGGYGAPWKRSPEKIRWDVVNGKVSTESARVDYLVALDQELNIDEAETARLRSSRQAVEHSLPD